MTDVVDDSLPEDLFIPKEVGWRLELLVGHLSDLLEPAQQLMSELRLRANASHASRSDLEFLIQQHGAIWQHLVIILDEVKEIRAELKALRES
jgi:hypothetical protein